MTRKTVYNSLVTEEKRDMINPFNTRLLDSWVKYLRMNGRSELTIKNYISDVEIFFVWLMENVNNIEFHKIQGEDIVNFQNTCINEYKWGNSRVRREKDTLSSFSNYIVEMKKRDCPKFKNIVRKVKSPKVNKKKDRIREVTFLTDEEVEKIFDGLRRADQYQCACILALCLYGGLRKGEISQFEREWFDKENIYSECDLLYITPYKIKVKGDNYQYKYILKQPFDKHLYMWIKQRNGNGLRRRKKLFLTYSTKAQDYVPMTETKLTGYAHLINKIMQEKGIDKVFYWNCTREFYIRKLKESNVPRRIVNDILESDYRMVNIENNFDENNESNLI